MKFVEITAEQFRDYAATSPYRSFMQTPEIAQLRQKRGWTPYYLAVTDDKIVDASTISDKPTSGKSAKTAQNTTKSAKPAKTAEPPILAAALVVAKPTFLGYQTFYTPGGPLLDLENTALTNFFFTHLIRFAREHKAYVLHIDPYFELRARDRNGRPVENGFDHTQALKNLQTLGFRPLSQTSMPQYLFARDLDLAETPDQIFASFKQNTRNLTRRAERLGVTVRELTREELPILKQITADTAARRHFVDQPLSYYQDMFDFFAPQGQIKFLLAEVPAEDSTSVNTTAPPTKIVDASTKSTKSPTPKTEQTPIPLSVAMFMLVGDEVVYLYSGSDQKYMKKYNAQYLIQWHMLKYAAEHGFKRYNFYGLRGLPDPQAPGYGIYRFKKGFGGHVVELIGSFELPLNQPIYKLHALLSRLKNLLP